MKSEKLSPIQSPTAALRELRGQILSGACPPLAYLSEEELAAAQELILEGQAEIVSRACRPHLTARLRDDGPRLFSTLRSLVKGRSKSHGA